MGTDHEGFRPDCCFRWALGRSELWSYWHDGEMSLSEWGMVGRREAGGWANIRCFTALAPSPARRAGWVEGRYQPSGHFPEHPLQQKHHMAWPSMVLRHQPCVWGNQGDTVGLVAYTNFDSFPCCYLPRKHLTAQVVLPAESGWLKMILSCFSCT